MNVDGLNIWLKEIKGKVKNGKRERREWRKEGQNGKKIRRWRIQSYRKKIQKEEFR